MKSFSQISNADLEEIWGIRSILQAFLPSIEALSEPTWLNEMISYSRKRLSTIRTEKATSEALIAPILMAVEQKYSHKITVFSGEPLFVNDLSGICDFLITKDPTAFNPKNGYLILVEAKRQDLLSGIPQCIAEMYAAQQLNGNQEVVYGCVSTGLEWLFLKLEDKIATTDPTIFTVSEVPKILGVFGWIIDKT